MAIIVAFVPGYSGGAVTDSHRLPLDSSDIVRSWPGLGQEHTMFALELLGLSFGLELPSLHLLKHWVLADHVLQPS